MRVALVLRKSRVIAAKRERYATCVTEIPESGRSVETVTFSSLVNTKEEFAMHVILGERGNLAVINA